MAALRSPTLRYLFGSHSQCQRGIQRRWAQVHDVRFLATHRQPDRVIEKYKEKLDRKAKEYAELVTADIHYFFDEKLTWI